MISATDPRGRSGVIKCPHTTTTVLHVSAEPAPGEFTIKLIQVPISRSAFGHPLAARPEDGSPECWRAVFIRGHGAHQVTAGIRRNASRLLEPRSFFGNRGESGPSFSFKSSREDAPRRTYDVVPQGHCVGKKKNDPS